MDPAKNNNYIEISNRSSINNSPKNITSSKPNLTQNSRTDLTEMMSKAAGSL